MTGKLKLYGDPISGNCLKARWTADYLGVDCDWVEFNILDGDSRTDEFLKINPAGQVPALVLPNGLVLTQSNAIIVYLAAQVDRGLLPDEAYQRAKVFQWLFWEQNSHEPYIAGRRFRKAYLGHEVARIDAEWLPRGYAALALMERALEQSAYLAGDRLTLADIALVAYTRTAGEGGFSLDDYPKVRAWITQVERDLAIGPVTEAA